MDGVDLGPLRRAAGWLDRLPPRPWQAVERTDVDRFGLPAWDPDVQPSRDAHDRQVARARQLATWRGLVDAGGDELVGEPLPGGSAPQPVSQPMWRFLAESPQLLDDVLGQARTMWRLLDGAPAAPPPARVQRTGAVRVVTVGQLERAARAAYDAVDDPGLPSWAALPEPERARWRDRALAAIEATWRA